MLIGLFDVRRHAMTSPQWFENLPVSPQDGVYPILLVAVSCKNSL